MENIFDYTRYEFHYVKKFISYQKTSTGVCFSCQTVQGENVKVKFDIINENIFRLRMQANEESANRKESLIIRKSWSRVPFRIIENPQGIILKTKGFEVKINKDPWQMSIFNNNKRLLLEESVSDVFPGNPGGQVVCPLGFCIDKKGNSSVFESFSIRPEEQFYGFGEKFSSLNKRGQKLFSWNVDPLCLNTTDRVYKNIPFFMSNMGYGIFINSSHKIIYEMGNYSFISYSFLIEDSSMDLFFFIGDFKNILKEYTEITGRAPVPPKWSFGLWMSKARYESRKEIEEVAYKLRKFKIPCDVIHLDSAWEKSFRKRKHSAFDYEWDEGAFPSPKEMIEELKKKGFKLCLATNPYINRETSKTYKEAIEGGYLVKGKNGKPICSSLLQIYRGIVAKETEDDFRKNPAYYYFIDFTNPRARLWLEDRLGKLLKMGVVAFKTDYGEFAPEDGIYYNGMRGQEMHNLYPLLYNKTIFEITKKYSGFGIVWGRSGYAGSQRYPVTWSGDSQGNFSTMACVLRGGLSYGLSGVPFWSHDIGGYLGKPNPVLYIRWAQFGLLSSHARCHGVTPREPWQFGPQILRIFRRYARLRYRLIPYLYSYAFIASQTGMPLMRALVLEYPDDPNVYHIDSEYLLGKELLIAPIFDEINQRNIYLPKGKWVDYWKRKEYEGPINLRYNAPLDILPVFVKKDSIIPLGQESDYVREGPVETLILDIYIEKKASFIFYDNQELIKFQCHRKKKQITFSISKSNKRYVLLFNEIELPKRIVLGNKILRRYMSEKEWKQGNEGWHSKKSIIKVKFYTHGTASVSMELA